MPAESGHSAAYDEHAGAYARVIEPTLVGMAERLAELAGAGPGTRLLDIATGTGVVARAAVARGAAVVGVDTASGMLELARERVPGADFILADVHELPFEDRSFDAVTCGLSVSHFAEPEQALGEALRVLRPGGLFAVSSWAAGAATPAAGAIGEVVERHGACGHASALDERTWMDRQLGGDALRDAGFAAVTTSTETFSGEFGGADEAAAWSLAWPLRAERLARLDEPTRERIAVEAREAVAEAERSWRFRFHLYAAERPG